METLRRKVQEALNEEFVGNYIFTEDELQLLYSYLRERLESYSRYYGSSMLKSDDALFFVAAVNVIKSWNSEDNTFLDYLFNSLAGEPNNGKLYQYFTSVINRLSDSNKVLVLESAKKKYYSTILAHAFAPLSSTEAFFDLCWDIYCEDLNQFYYDQDEVYLFAAQQLKQKFDYDSSDDQEFNLGSHAYGLRAGIRGIAREDVNVMSRLIQRTIGYINTIFNGGVTKSLGYYEELIKEWWRKKEASSGSGIKRTRKYSQGIVTDYRNIRPKFVFNAGSVLLVLPPIRLRDQIDFDPFLTVYVDDEVVYSESMRTRGSGLIMTTIPTELEISEWVQKAKSLDFSVEITHCGDTIYQSGSDLYREFLLFKDGKEVFDQECFPGNYALFTCDIDENLGEYPEEIKKVAASTYLIHTADGDVIQSANRVVVFSSEKRQTDIWTMANKKSNVFFRRGGEKFFVIDGDLRVAMKDDVVITQYLIKVSGKEYSLLDFPLELSSGMSYHNITSIVKVGSPEKISIIRREDNRIINSINVIKFNNIRIEYDKPVYYGMDFDKSFAVGHLSFKTNLYDEEASFDLSNEEIAIPISGGDLIFSPPIFKWRIDDGPWHKHESRQGLWYKDLSNSSELSFNLPPNVGSQLVLTNNSFAENSDKGGPCYKIGETIYSLLDSSDQLGLIASLDLPMFLPVATVYLKPQFRDDPLYQVTPQLFRWNPEDLFAGDADPRFELSILRGDHVEGTIDLDLQACDLDVSEFDTGYYRLKIDLLGTGFLRKRTELYKKDFCFGDENDLRFKNKELLITSVMREGSIVPRQISPCKLTGIKFLSQQGLTKYYSATLKYLFKRTGPNGASQTKKDEDVINPVRIEIKSDRTLDLMGAIDDYSIGSCKYELGLDKFGYIVRMDSETTVIDYCFYEVKELANV